MPLLLGGEEPEEHLLLPVPRALRHAGVHLPPLGLEPEGLPHRRRGVPRDRLLLLDPAVLPLEEAHPPLAAHGGDDGEPARLFQLLRDREDVLVMLPLHVGQESENALREAVGRLLLGQGEVAHPGLLEPESPGERASGVSVFPSGLGRFRHRHAPFIRDIPYYTSRSRIPRKKKSCRAARHSLRRGRFPASRIFFRMRIDAGVISTSSSSLMNSRADSRERIRGGTSRSASSAPAARMFVSFFSFVMFTSMSTGRVFSPTIIPSYTCSPSPMKNVPRDWRWKMAYAVVRPTRSETSAPLIRSGIGPCQGS